MADLMQQIGSIDHAICEARYGSPATLAAVAAAMPALTSSVTGNAAETVRAGSLQIGLNFAEMVDDAYVSAMQEMDAEWSVWRENTRRVQQEVFTLADELGVDLSAQQAQLEAIEEQRADLDMENPVDRLSAADLNVQEAALTVDMANMTYREALARGNPAQIARAEAALRSAEVAHQHAQETQQREAVEAEELAARNVERAEEHHHLPLILTRGHKQ